MLYLITVNYYSTELIVELLASIQASTEAVPCAVQARATIVQPPAYKVIVVNNAPEDRQIHSLAGQALVLDAGANVGFGSACNVALNWVYERDPQAIVWLINPDAQLTVGALAAAATFFHTQPERSIVGTVVREPDGTLWFGGGRFTPATGEISAINLVADSASDYAACDWVTGCSLLLNLQRFSGCPQFDPAYFLYYEDFDFCRRYAVMKHSVGVTNQITVVHSPSSITDRDRQFKFRHSTYSYLLTLERYTTKLVLTVRLLRIVLRALLLLATQPKVAIGKFAGVWMYFKRTLRFEQPISS
ncbi:glycosyltransferase family 2 protein [Leptolyngbya sp. FACHB-36]|uniref:glycosyltransferase n=1 Tax=Leptolyngbya sp. FACHB-36 TaxID=2692808 RepID=UPI0016810AB3|nr:glycosyltransferase [Leptolyngbya sp. FACHB-36]MBD2021840.1 glycosyltransferase family 2 protein [Leptolyngbya sp. FACHB-36]